MGAGARLFALHISDAHFSSSGSKMCFDYHSLWKKFFFCFAWRCFPGHEWQTVSCSRRETKITFKHKSKQSIQRLLNKSILLHECRKHFPEFCTIFISYCLRSEAKTKWKYIHISLLFSCTPYRLANVFCLTGWVGRRTHTFRIEKLFYCKHPLPFSRSFAQSLARSPSVCEHVSDWAKRQGADYLWSMCVACFWVCAHLIERKWKRLFYIYCLISCSSTETPLNVATRTTTSVVATTTTSKTTTTENSGTKQWKMLMWISLSLFEEPEVVLYPLQRNDMCKWIWICIKCITFAIKLSRVASKICDSNLLPKGVAWVCLFVDGGCLWILL